MKTRVFFQWAVLSSGIWAAGVSWSQDVANVAPMVPADLELSAHYRSRPYRAVQCFLSQTDSKNRADNRRRSFQMPLGPQINVFRSTKSVRFGYVPGALTTEDPVYSRLIQLTLTTQLGFPGAKESPVFEMAMKREPVQRTDGEWVLMETFDTRFLKNSAETVAEQPVAAVASHSENPSFSFGPGAPATSPIFVLEPNTKRGAFVATRQTFESGTSYFLKCHVCVPTEPGSCMTENEQKAFFDPQFFQSASDPLLKKTFIGHENLNWQ